MKPETAIRHEFVEFIPDDLEPETLYISIRFATASHLCCCGCGNRVVTPIRPTDWKLVFDGKTVSLHPSIGNWSFSCRSHYWIRNNRVQWAPTWSVEQVERGRRRDSYIKEDYFAEPNIAGHVRKQDTGMTGRDLPQRGIWQAVKKWFS